MRYYQNPQNAQYLSVQNLTKLRVNVLRGDLPTYTQSLFALSSAKKSLPPTDHAIFGHRMNIILPNAKNEDADVTMGNKIADSNHWYKLAKQETKNPKDFAYVIISSNVDALVGFKNAENLKNSKSYKKTTLPLIIIVPFEKFGSLHKVYEWNIQNKGLIGRAITWEEALIFEKIGLLNTESING
jgi:hypothetical protein